MTQATQRPVPPARPVRFAVVGCGNIAGTHADALSRLRARGLAEAVAFCDIVPERADRFAARFGGRALAWGEILASERIDAVTICTPSGTHAALGIDAARAGKHVVVEKPMDADVAAARRLAAVAAASGVVLAVISQHRFDAATEEASRLVADELGRIALVEARVAWLRTQDYYDADPWRGTIAGDGGGALINQAIHTVDLMLELAGPVLAVSAAATTLLRDIEAEDVVVASLRFASGALGTLAATTLAAPGYPARLAVFGEGGAFAIEGDALVLNRHADGTDGAKARAREDAIVVATGGSRAIAGTTAPGTAAPGTAAPSTDAPSTDAARSGTRAAAWGDAHEKQLADAVGAIRTGTRPRSGATEGLAVLELIDAIYRSAREGRWISLPNAASAP